MEDLLVLVVFGDVDLLDLACSSFSSCWNTLSIFSEYSLISSNSRAFLSLVNFGCVSKLEKDCRNLTFCSVVLKLATFWSIAGVKSDKSRAWSLLNAEKNMGNMLSTIIRIFFMRKH